MKVFALKWKETTTKSVYIKAENEEKARQRWEEGDYNEDHVFNVFGERVFLDNVVVGCNQETDGPEEFEEYLKYLGVS
ncbi:MAG: hypothetical protein FWG63_00435 [Defluviitaleaceae bacterium]|nr:hypothetical protein [Defluviitaleaceae bacterium]